MRQPRIFDHFPQHNDPVVLCPVCGTNEDAPCVLLPIEKTGEGFVSQALPVHVNCAVATAITKTAYEEGSVQDPASPLANVRMLFSFTGDRT